MTLDPLLKVSTMTLATCDAQGNPHAAPVYFASGEKLHLYYFSDPDSQHGRDLQADPRASIAIYPDTRQWQQIRGFQMRGRAHLVIDPGELELGWKLYVKKFPFVKLLKNLVEENQLYVFEPDWVRKIDNRLGIGHKEEWT